VHPQKFDWLTYLANLLWVAGSIELIGRLFDQRRVTDLVAAYLTDLVAAYQ